MRQFALSMAAIVAVSCSDAGLSKYNSDPEASITSHVDDDTVQEGVTETIRGQVGDPNHSIADLSVTWLVNGSETCTDSIPDDEGSVVCDTIFAPDGGEVLLEVRDPEGAGDSAKVVLNVQPTDAPLTEITAPIEDGVYYSDQLITFQGTVSDTEDAVSDLTVTWETADLGDLALSLDVTTEGSVEAFGNLDEGEHAVRLRAVDTTGKEGVSSVIINVGPPNSAPTCAITAPETGAAGPEGEVVTFTGTAEDVDVASDWLAVNWESDKDGTIGESTPNSSGSVTFPFSDLTVNTHVITMTVTDEIGETCATDVAYTVGTPPTLTVTAPTDGSTLNHSDAVVFEAEVNDNEDLPNEVSLSWESDLDGVFSTDGSDSSGAVTISIDTLSSGDHVVTVTATDTDGLYVTDTVSFNLNQPPTTPTVTLEPDPAATNQMLVATATGSEDPEGTGTVTYAYAWFEDGVATAESTSATFPSEATGKHHTYRVQVTASDGLVESAFGFAEVSVINSDPALSGPTLSAATAVVGDVLTCTASTTDIDPEDTPTITYAWSDGTAGDTYVVSMDDAVDSTITCTATADDADGGIVTGTASATATNTAPTVDSVEVDPAEGQVGDMLTCTATAADDDGETPTIAYAWSDGSTGNTYTITAEDAVDSEIVCTATATDMHGLTGTGTASATVTNSAPNVDTVAVTPLEASVGDTLTCTATASDPDGTTPVITYAWSTGETGTSYTVTDSDDPGSVITCTATATDTYGLTDSASETATVSNTEPVMTGVSISPDPAYNDDTLVCSAAASDADGGSPSITYAWTGGATGAELPLTSIIAASGDTLSCTATADDGDGGTVVDTASITIGNRAPTVIVSIAPDTPTKNDTLTCTASGVTDPDDDATTLAFTWTVGGAPVAATSTSGSITTLAAVFLAGQTVACRADVDDGKDGVGDDTASVEIVNTAPEVSSVTLSPASVYTNDTITATATTSDDDGDMLTITYTFSVDGDVVQDGPSDTLDGTVYFDKGQDVSVTVTVDDTTDTATGSSDSVTVLNTPPTAPAVGIEWIEGDFAAQFNSGAPIAAPGMGIGSTGPRTLMAWVKPDEFAEMKFFGLGGDPNMVVKSNPAGHLVVQCHTGTQSVADVLTPDTWTHVAVTWQSGTVRLYADGERLLESSGLDCLIDDTAMFIGADVASGPYPWHGAMEEVKIWGARLSDGEVLAEMEEGLTRSSESRAYYPLDEGEGTSVADASGTGRDTTHPQGTWTESRDSADLPCSTCLVCSIDEESTDADGDTISYTVDWDVDGTPYTDTDTTTEDGDTIPGDALGYDETWTCDVTPNDGEDDGDVGSASYDVEAPCYGNDESCPGVDCLDILESGFSTGDGTYWINPDETDAFEAYCDMTTDGGGWTLIAMVHPTDGTELIDEEYTWFRDGNNPDPLATNTEVFHAEPSSFGVDPFVDHIWGMTGSVARFTLTSLSVPGASQTWFKDANPLAFAQWFADDAVPTAVCSDPDLSTDCTAPSTIYYPCSACAVNFGMGLTDYGIGGSIHMRLNDVGAGPVASPSGTPYAGVAANVPGGTPTAEWATWGNPLTIWLKGIGEPEPTYAWTNIGSSSEEMVYGSCVHVESSSATCDASTLGERIYINPTGADNLEKKELGETHLGVTGGRGFSISISGAEASWQGATGCGADYLQTDTVDIYACSYE